jgi:SCY1-like protein 1
MTLAKHSASIPAIVSPDLAAAFNDETEDFGDDWGGFGGDNATTSKAADEEEDPWAAPAPAATTTTTSFDDQGEPDFAGWLAAQSQAKKPGKSPLPRGLSKPTMNKSTRPIIGGRASTTGTARKVVVAPKKEEKKVEEKKKSAEEEDEGWGDAW